MIFLHTGKEPVHDYVRQALFLCPKCAHCFSWLLELRTILLVNANHYNCKGAMSYEIF